MRPEQPPEEPEEPEEHSEPLRELLVVPEGLEVARLHPALMALDLRAAVAVAVAEFQQGMQRMAEGLEGSALLPGPLS